MRYGKLIENIVSSRPGFEGIIKEIYRGNTGAVEDLDYKVFNEHNRNLFLWDAKEMEGRKRYSADGEGNERDYYNHCASSANIVSILMNSNDKDRDEAISYALVHDFIDGALDFNPAEFGEKKKLYSPQYDDELNAAIIMSSNSESYLSKLCSVMQVKELGNRAHAYAMIAEKLDSQLELDYLNDKPEDKRKKIIANRFLAYPLFVANELSGLTHELVKPVKGISEITRKTNGISKEMVKEYLRDFLFANFVHEKKIKAAIKEHLQKFGYEIPEGSPFS